MLSRFPGRGAPEAAPWDAAAAGAGAALAGAGALLVVAGGLLAVAPGAALPGAGGATPIIVCFNAERAAERVLFTPGRDEPDTSGFCDADTLGAALDGMLRGADWFALAAPPVPSTMIAAPQRLHVILTFR